MSDWTAYTCHSYVMATLNVWESTYRSIILAETALAQADTAFELCNIHEVNEQQDE